MLCDVVGPSLGHGRDPCRLCPRAQLRHVSHGERGAGGRCEDGVEVSSADPPQHALRHRRERQIVVAPAQSKVYGLHFGAPRVQLRRQGG
eukprot:3301813-Pleurochrysis_carterae.AAC.1